jgi:hypothetical protein
VLPAAARVRRPRDMTGPSARCLPSPGRVAPFAAGEVAWHGTSALDQCRLARQLSIILANGARRRYALTSALHRNKRETMNRAGLVSSRRCQRRSRNFASKHQT